MRYILAQPAHPRFQWELDVVLTNIYSLEADADVVCLFGVPGGSQSLGQRVVEHISSRYPRAEVHAYSDDRRDKSYAPTIRPYLWTRFLVEDRSREDDTYFQIDSDVIFRELPDWSKVPYSDKVWYGSDCAGYIDYDYLRTRRRGEELVDNFARLLEIDRSVIERTEGVGAQWVISKPTAYYWEKVYNDSNTLWHHLEFFDSDIQKWTAEMWAQLYAAPYFGIEQKISSELDFCRPTDDIKMWDMTKILHNAGVIGSEAESLFFKGKYVDTTPFGQDLSWVRKDKAGLKYAQAIQTVRL